MKKVTCPNGHSFPEPSRMPYIDENGLYSFRRHEFVYCPRCGKMMPHTKEKLLDYLEIVNVHPKLKHSIDLLLLSEYEAAVREAAVTVECVLKEKSGLNLHGQDLAIQALKFTYDSKAKTITTPPLIFINSLVNESERNEQEGLRYSLMGFFSGKRNLYQHNHIGSGVSSAFAIIFEVSTYLHQLDGKSLLKNGRWIKEDNERTQLKLLDVLRNTTNFIDRIRFCILFFHIKNHKRKS